MLSFKLSTYPGGSICHLAKLNEMIGCSMEVRSPGILCSFPALSSKVCPFIPAVSEKEWKCSFGPFQINMHHSITFINIKRKACVLANSILNVAQIKIIAKRSLSYQIYSIYSFVSGSFLFSLSSTFWQKISLLKKAHIYIAHLKHGYTAGCGMVSQGSYSVSVKQNDK